MPIAALDLALHPRDQSTYEREPDAGAGLRARELVLRAVERLEDRAELSFVDARAAVGDRDANPAVVRGSAAHADAAFLACAAVLERVVEQVEQHLRQRIAIEARRG